MIQNIWLNRYNCCRGGFAKVCRKNDKSHKPAPALSWGGGGFTSLFVLVKMVGEPAPTGYRKSYTTMNLKPLQLIFGIVPFPHLS